MREAADSAGRKAPSAGNTHDVAGMSTPTVFVDPAHVLVVDDNEVNRDLLARRLQREGHRVGLAVDGLDALAKLRADAFDLVLLDIMMPGMDGYQVLEQLKADEALRHVPVILISALNDTDNMVKGISLGADDYLPKPFNPHILRARVNASLARKRLRDCEQLYARSLEREMDIAREIQAGFLPRRLPVYSGWDMAAYFQPARQVGGDFYDAFSLHGGQRFAVVMADVCDKGVGAALFMALFRSFTRAFAERMNFLGDDAHPWSRQHVCHVVLRRDRSGQRCSHLRQRRTRGTRHLREAWCTRKTRSNRAGRRHAA